MATMNERDPLEKSDPRYAPSGEGRPTDDRPAPSADAMLTGQLAGYGVLPGEQAEPAEDDVDGAAPTPQQVLRFIASSEPKANEFFQDKAMDKVLSVYRAARNEHPEKSKYNSPLFKARANYHRPKTRNAIKRVQTAAANALFAARNVIEISPGDESNPQHRAAAAMRKELVNYRLSRASGRNSIPWFETSIGARTDAYTTGYSVSLQTWSYRKRSKGFQPFIGRDGRELTQADGTPVMREVYEVVIDRPDVTLYPIENVGIDPAAPWQNPAQGASFLYLKDPVYANDLKVTMKQARNGRTNIPWKDPREIAWTDGRVDPNSDSRSVRTSRGDGATDRMEDTAGTVEFEDGNALVWRYLWFFRWRGEDYCVYTLGTKALLSEPIPTAEAFPHLGGERPVVIGTDLIAPHDLLPMSNAAALQPMQQEINDQVNLRIDAIRQSVYPLAKVKRGRNIDITSLTKRGPSSNILVEDKDDVSYELPPNGAGQLFQEMDRLNNDFDETAGIFSNSSVQGQRSLNETVGGMKILAGDANAVANLELRIWTETWVERVIGQISAMEAFYETDERILSICGTRAQLDTKFGVNTINDDLLLAEVQCLVDIGTGAADPNESISRFKMAMDAIWPYVGVEVQAGRATINAKDIVNEVFGHAGYKDAGDRFIQINAPDAPTPQQVEQLQQQLDEANARLQEIELGKEAEKAMTKAKLDTELAKQEADQRHEKQMLFIQARIDQIKALMQNAMGAQADQRKAGFAAQADERKGRMAAAADERKGDLALEGDKRALTMSERSAKREDQRAARGQLLELQQQVMAGQPPPMGSPTEQLMPPPAPPPGPEGPPPGMEGPPPGMEGAPPGLPPPGGGLPPADELAMGGPPMGPEGMPPPGGPPPGMGGPPPGPPMMPPPGMDEGMDPMAGPEMDMMSPVMDVVQQAVAGMAQQLLIPMQQMMMEVQRQVAETNRAQTELILQALTAPQVIERGPDGKVVGARRQLPPPNMRN